MEVDKVEKIIKELEDVTKPVVEFIKRNYNPYTTVVITDEYVKVARDEIGLPIKRTDSKESILND